MYCLTPLSQQAFTFLSYLPRYLPKQSKWNSCIEVNFLLSLVEMEEAL